MGTHVPITIEGNLTADPEYGVADNGTKYARFTVAVTDRRLDGDTWVDGDTKFHKTSVFGRQAENVRDSLSKGDTVLVNGSLQFRHWEDNEGNKREGTEVVADAVGPSLRFRSATPNRAAAPKANGPDASATGPVATTTAARKTATLGR